MKKINISIDNAKIIDYSVRMDEKYPTVSATIGLFSGTKMISTFSIDSREYYGTQKFEVTASMIAPIKKLAKELEYIATIKCSSSIGMLEGKVGE